MMKYVGALTLIIPLSSFAVKIPADHFDQSKLEYTLRQIPVAYVKSVQMPNFVRKFYSFPKINSLFKIDCSADYYRSSPVPSNSDCTLDVFQKNSIGMSIDLKGDEYRVFVNESSIVRDLYRVMPVTGTVTRKIYSTEKLDGQTYEGTAGIIFRYVFECSEKDCILSFTAKDSAPELFRKTKQQ